MYKSAQRVLLETLIDQSCRGFGDSPHRELRKLVDLGHTVVTGPFQKAFFAMGQQILQHDDSPYYAMIASLAQHLNRDAIKQIGINVGYESWTRGAGTIRLMESELGYSIPWALVFEAGVQGPALPPERLASILTQGRQLGLHTFYFYVVDGGIPLRTVLALAEEFDDCAFVLLTRPDQLPDNAAHIFLNHPNCLPCIQASTDYVTEELMAQLYRYRVLYGLWVPYTIHQIPELLSGAPSGLERCAELAAELDAPLTLLTAMPGCTAQDCRTVSEAVCRLRLNPVYPTVSTDLYSDLMRIDEIISGKPCLAQIWPDGRVSINGTPAPFGLNAHTLRAVLASASEHRN